MQKGTAALFVIIAILLLLGLIGVFALRLVRSPIPQLPFKVPISTPTTKFLTYTNQDLGFEFQYSNKDLKITEDSEEEYNKRGNGNFRKNFSGYVGYEPGFFLGAVVVLEQDEKYDNSPLTVWIFNNDNNLTIEQWFQDYWYYPFLWGVFDWTSKGHIAPDQEATISGQMAKYRIVSYQPDSPKYLYLSSSGKMYLFRAIGEVGDEILTTFALQPFD